LDRLLDRLSDLYRLGDDVRARAGAELRALETQPVAEHPKQRLVAGSDSDLNRLAVKVESDQMLRP
jgi:hypothetical protein